MSRLPIRWRVTVAFGGALLAVLGAVAVGVFLRLDAALGEAIDRGLQARAAEIVAGQQAAPRFETPDRARLEREESPAQILDTAGRVVASSLPGTRSLLNPEQLRAAGTAAVRLDRPGDAALDESLRVLALPVTLAGRPYVLVVGESLDEKRETLSTLATIGSIGLGAALLASAWAGYLVIGLALRPVQAMTAEAEAISGVPDRRLPVPAADDELGRLGTTLNRMLDRIERARAAERDLLDRERRFVADASHELRTPLTVLRSEIEVALIGTRGAAELHAALESARDETHRVCRLADDLLTLAGVEDRPPHRRSVDVALLVSAVVDRQRSHAATLGRRIVTSCPADLRADLDPDQIGQALTNLLDNALRHGRGDVRCTAGCVDGELRLAVADDGPGFPEAFTDRAFHRFSRAAAGRDGSGTGLGLAIVAAIAQAHHGRAVIGSGPGAAVEISLRRSDSA